MRAGSENQRTLVVSGVGMNEGGILSVLRHVVDAAERVLDPSWRIVVLAHRRELLEVGRAEIREYPDVKASWFKRVWFEWFHSQSIARELNAEVWLALHDITPRVNVRRQYVYCHNPTVFSRPTLRALRFDKVFVAHSLLYGLLYSLNIRRNSRVFVQQNWIADQFVRRFRAKSVMVASPASRQEERFQDARESIAPSQLKTWIYPTFPRHFKNIELIGEALSILEKNGGWGGEVRVTVSGGENGYSRWIVERYGHLKTLVFVGRLEKAAMQSAYAAADGLIFPSKLETWGLPITEAQSRGMPILAADLEYSHETVGRYEQVSFFDPDDAAMLAKMLMDFSCGRGRWAGNQGVSGVAYPALAGWDALVREVCQLGEIGDSLAS